MLCYLKGSWYYEGLSWVCEANYCVLPHLFVGFTEAGKSSYPSTYLNVIMLHLSEHTVRVKGNIAIHLGFKAIHIKLLVTWHLYKTIEEQILWWHYGVGAWELKKHRLKFLFGECNNLQCCPRIYEDCSLLKQKLFQVFKSLMKSSGNLLIYPFSTMQSFCLLIFDLKLREVMIDGV